MTVVRLPRRLLGGVSDMCRLAHPMETGGVVVGRYVSTTEVLVTELMGPPADSMATRSTFLRGQAGLTEALREVWPDSYYVGEWHYHPGQTEIVASPMDQEALLKISQDEGPRCPCPIMLIFGERRPFSLSRAVEAFMASDGIFWPIEVMR